MRSDFGKNFGCAIVELLLCCTENLGPLSMAVHVASVNCNPYIHNLSFGKIFTPHTQGLRDWSWCLYCRQVIFKKNFKLQKSLLNPVDYTTVTLLSATINCINV